MIETANNEEVSSIIENYFHIKNPFNVYSKVIVYRQDNDIKGILVYDEIYDRIEIDYILVLEEYRKKGIGTELLKYFNNNQNISLEVRKSNIVAIEFYKKNGFRVVAKREKYYNGEDALLMCRGC